MALTLKQNELGQYTLDTTDVYKDKPVVLNQGEFEAYTGKKGKDELTEQTERIIEREAPGQIELTTDPETGEVVTKQEAEKRGVVTRSIVDPTQTQQPVAATTTPVPTVSTERSRSQTRIPSISPAMGFQPSFAPQQFQPQSTKDRLIDAAIDVGSDLAIRYVGSRLGLPTGGTNMGVPQGTIGGGFGGGFGGAAGTSGFMSAGNVLLQGGSPKQAAKTGAGAAAGTAIGTAIGGPIGGAIGGTIGGAVGGRVICTELYRQGLINKKDYILDLRFTELHLTPEHVKGYWYFAIPAVKSMRKSKLSTQFWKHIATNRIKDIKWRLGKGKFNLLGRVYSSIFEPLCKFTGKFVKEKDYHKELYT